MVRIERADDMEIVRELLIEYGRATGVDLSFQNFEQEVEGLPGDYDPILIAWRSDTPAGCVALRSIDDEICEMKRLYIRPAFRGQQIGRALAEAIMGEARLRAFQRMRLDTLPSMTAAMSLYETLGFRDIGAYRYNPIAGTRYMEVDL